MPVEDVIQITSLSENAFYYFGKQELKHKLILIEDLNGAGEVLYPLRELQSKKVITKTVVYKNQAGEAQTVHLRVEGPVCVAGCTTKESIYEDNSNRSFLLYLDESKEQDEKIMHYQRLKSAGKVDPLGQAKVRQLLQNVQRVLQPVQVRNPYAEHLQLPISVFKPRRTNAHYLAFIEVITFYHQLQLLPAQILPIHEYLQETRLLLKPKSDELFPGNLDNTIYTLVQELQGINPTITNALHIRGSVIINWLKLHNKRQVQYMAGHKYISSTEAYAVQEIDTLQDELSKHHPFG